MIAKVWRYTPRICLWDVFHSMNADDGRNLRNSFVDRVSVEAHTADHHTNSEGRECTGRTLSLMVHRVKNFDRKSEYNPCLMIAMPFVFWFSVCGGTQIWENSS